MATTTKAGKKKKSTKKKPEFTKVIMGSILATYFVGIVIGAIVVLSTSSDQLYAFLTFIGAPTATAIGFYCWKAKNENIHKHPDVYKYGNNTQEYGSSYTGGDYGGESMMTYTDSNTDVGAFYDHEGE